METSIIICTYNEEKTIADVVSACCTMKKDCEIIIIDDGSTDNTEEILNEMKKTYRFIYEKLPENMGKSWAMAHGVKIASNEIILFFDADISNIREEHFQKLLEPILLDHADMVLGQPSETLINYKINPFRSLTGERAILKKDILPVLDDIKDIRFGVETFINLYYQSMGKRIKYVLLKNLKHPTKYEKISPGKATTEFIKEGQEIATTILENYDLIIQRLLLPLKKSDMIDKQTFNKFQKSINPKFIKRNQYKNP